MPSIIEDHILPAIVKSCEHKERNRYKLLIEENSVLIALVADYTRSLMNLIILNPKLLPKIQKEKKDVQSS